MDSTTLAQSFNDVSEQLRTRGQRIILRRVRGFLEAGDTRGADLFLDRAREALGSDDGGVGGLAIGLNGFAASGGNLARLVAEPAWVQGSARETRLSRLVDDAVSQQGLAGLVDQLARQRHAQAVGEPLATAPSRGLAPSALPAQPRGPTVGSEAATRAALGSIIKPVRGRAVIEAEVELEARPLALDAPARAAHPMVDIPEVEDLAPARMSVVSPLVDFAEAPDAPPGPSERSARHETAEPRPMELPELHAPPEMAVAPTPAPGGSGNLGLLVGVAVALAAIAAGVYFATR